jgi:kynurenine formamidase
MCFPGTVEAVREAYQREPTGHYHLTDHHEAADHHEVATPQLSRRALVAAGGAVALSTLVGAPETHAAQRPTRLQDLTYVFSETFPVAAGFAPKRSTLFTYAKDQFYAQQWAFWEHTATHLDAPVHFVPGGRTVPELAPAELMYVPAAVINIAERAAKSPDAQVEITDLLQYERRYGRIAQGAMVIMNSGWTSRVNNPDAFLGVDKKGQFHWPGWSPEAAQFLVEEREISGVGVDTISIDRAIAANFPVHHRVLGANHFALENLAHLDDIPPKGALLFVGVVPWKEGSGGPCRIIAQL